jgi:hypothetical protein
MTRDLASSSSSGIIKRLESCHGVTRSRLTRMVEIVVINHKKLLPLVLAFLLWPVAQTSIHSSLARIGKNIQRPMCLRSISSSADSVEAVPKAMLRESKNLQLRGGEGSFFSVFETLDKAGTKTFGNGLWEFLKSMVGLGSTRVQRSPKEDLAALQKEMESRKQKDNLKDRRTMYFVMQGPSYFLNPVVHLLRYIRGTEKQVRAAVIYLQDPPERAANHTMEQHLAALAAPPPEGFGLSRARIREALYRANIKVDEELLEPSKKTGGKECTSLDGIKVRRVCVPTPFDFAGPRPQDLRTALLRMQGEC